MAQFATSDDHAVRLAELDVAVTDAWTDYRLALRDLTGREYDEAEIDAWEHLQAELEHLEVQRRALVG
ncbi:MAG: hypothetical protein JHC95_11325 [Solirubrobacteraceae bacterium]|nr:hypothetical protein [Solirubrobacteraceae bacterium]